MRVIGHPFSTDRQWVRRESSNRARVLPLIRADTQGTPLTNYELIDFSPSDLEEVESQWRSVAGDEVFQLECAPLFTWAAANIERRQGYGHARGLRNLSTGYVDAILETTTSPQLRMTKLIKVVVGPDFWITDDPDDDEVAELVRTHAACYGTVLGDAEREEFREVKIYGREPFSFSMLKRVQQGWDSTTTGWDARMKGRWLSLTRVSSTNSAP